MKINNVVLKARLNCKVDEIYNKCIEYKSTPQMLIYKSKTYKIIIFKNAKCRIMGRHIPVNNLPLPITIEDVQTMSATHDLGKSLNLIHVASKLPHATQFEPEIFPAIRFIIFKPTCVNVFASGKVTMLGLKSEVDGHIILFKLNKLLQSI